MSRKRQSHIKYMTFTLVPVMLVMMVLVVISQANLANASSTLPSDTNWNTVKTAIDSYIAGQFGAGGSEGEAGFTMDNAGLKPRIDQNLDGVYLGEGDDAASAPVLIDNLRGQTTIIPGTSYRCSWNADCFESANVATVKALVDAHKAAGFSTDTVVYCGSGHTEAPTTGAYGFIANASDGAGGYGLSSAGTGIPKVYAFKWGRNGWINTVATYANSGGLIAAEASTATATVTPYSGCASPTSDADLVRCEARYAIYLTANGGRYSVTANGNNTGPTSINTALGAGGQAVDIRTGPPAQTTDITGNQMSVPLDTLFNTGLTNVDGSATTLVVGRTPMVSGIAAQGLNMLGYNMVAGTFINGGMPGWKSGQAEQQAAQTAYATVAITNYTAPAKVDTVNPTINNTTGTAATGRNTASVIRNTSEPATSKIALTGSGGAPAVNVNNTVLNVNKTTALTGLVPGTTYTGTLTVYDAQANSASTPISFTTDADITAPTITNILPSGFITGPTAVISADYSDDAGGAGVDATSVMVHLDGSNMLMDCPIQTTSHVECNATAPDLATGSHPIDIYVSDLAATPNTRITRSYLYVDNVAPTTSSNAPGGWQNADVTVTLTCDDGTGSGCASTSWSGDNGLVSGSGNTVVVSAVGVTTISYHSTDTLGNVETPDKTATVNIDKTNPVIGATTPTGWLASASPATVTAAVTETGAGLNPALTVLQIDGVSPPACNVSNTQIDCDTSSMPPLSQGNHVITVSTADMAGNPGTGGGTFDVDTSAPFVSNNLPTGTSGNINPTISADFTDGAGSGINLSTVQVSVNGTPEIIGAGGCTVTATGVSCPKTGLTDNTYNVTVSVTDNLGFTGSLGWAFVVNTAAPTIDSLVPAIGAWTYDNTPTATINYHATGTIDSATLTIDNTPCAGAVWDQTHITCTAPALTDGPHTIRGNIGVGPNVTPANPSNGTFSVDSTQPVLTNKTPSGWIQTAGTIEADITETGSGIDGASSSISVDGTPILNANCTWTDTHVSCTAPALPAGNHWTSYVVYDNVGLNNGFANSLAGFDVDLSAPTVSGITPAGIIGSASPTIEFDVSDGTGSGNNASLTVVNLVHGSPTISETISCTNVVDHFSCPASGLLETEYNVMIDVTDNVGNHRAYGNPAQFTVDVSGPAIANFTPTGWINSATPTMSFDVTDTGSGVNLASLSTTLPGSAVCSNSPITNGYHFSCPATGLTTGQYGATISVSDNLGNSSSASGSVLFSVDLDNPEITNLLPSGDVTSNSVTISADLNDPLASGIKSDINSASAAIHLDGSGTALTGCSKTAAQISCPATIGVGAHTFSVTVNDNAGNSATNSSGAFTLTQQNYYFPWYDNNAGNGMNGDWIMINNEGIAAADVYIYVGDISDGATPAGHVNIAAGGHTEWQSPTSRTTGPVRVKSDGSPLQVSQRVIYKDTFNEVRAVSQSEIDSEYFYTWYDRTSPDMRGDWVLVANVGASATADVYIEIAGVDMINPATGTTKFSIPAGTVITPQFIGTTSGMVHVTCTSCTGDAKIITSQRVLYKDSFNEVNGIPNAKLASEAWFTWYDNNNLRGFNHDWVMVVNNGSITTNVQIFLGDSVTAAADVAVPAGGSLHWQSFLPRTTGPVHVVSSNGQPLIVSQRVLYKDSFNEVQGAYATDLGSGARFNWYDNLTPGIVGDWILVGSAGTASDMNIQIGAVAAGTPNVASKTTVPSIYPMAGAPIQVACSGCGGSDKFVISQRVLYKNSFDELLGKPTS